MEFETALFFETVEQIYSRVFRLLKPRTSIPRVTVRFVEYASANSRIRFREDHLTVHISDLFKDAPAPVQEALAYILLGKLFGKPPELSVVARYRRYLNGAEFHQTLHLVKQQRGRKVFRNPNGKIYNLEEIFEELNVQYFHGLMARPQLGWSATRSCTALGHYDPSHNMIVLSSLFDTSVTSRLVIKFVMFHEMLHLKYPTEHRATRRCVHTKEFKQAEKKFEGYQQAKAALRKFLESSVPGRGETL